MIQREKQKLDRERSCKSYIDEIGKGESLSEIEME